MDAEIRYLEENEKNKSRELWEEAFPEDSREFDDYYFSEKTRDNKILVKEENGKILSMVHLNPYEVKIKNRVYPLDYIVGVATKKDRRHKGHMRTLLIRMMEDMYKERVPFTFLMPASEKIYYPFDFRFIFNQPLWKTEESSYREIRMAAGWMETGKDNVHEMADWMKSWLEKRYQVYTVRSEDYVKRLDKELASENGEWTFLYKGDKMTGIRCEWGLGEREQRLLYMDGINSSVKTRPAIMGRIICLEEFVKSICLKKECPYNNMEATIKVRDNFLGGNAGLWKWKLDKKRSVLEKIPEERNSGNNIVFTIGEIIEWLSGYKFPEEELLKREEWMAWVQPLQGVFLDEIV